MERTLAIVKPDGVADRHSGKIIDRILAEGFTIRGLRQLRMSQREAEGFYAVHKERPFYGELCGFMSSAPCIVIALEAPNAVQKWRDLIGATDPAQAAPNTIRKLYARSKGENAVHGSDSAENGRSEIAYWFAETELA